MKSMENNSTLERKAKRSIFWDRFTYILIAALLALSVLFGGVVLYQKFYFSTTYVSGQSMYPYLNSEVTNNGQRRKSGNILPGDKDLDLVLVDGHDNIMNNIKRFDVVVTRTDTSADLIKRVIALPGETFYFGSGNQLGELFIKNKQGSFDLVPQPIEKQYYALNVYNIPFASKNFQDSENPTTLGDNEYFLCGDNRAHSSDSRDLNYGPFNKSKLKGVVVALIGHCDATEEPVPTYTNIRYDWPRFIKL